jgi:hypothetical protein
MDDAALRDGTPKVEFTRYGLGHGPVTITMPDGEILHGEYQVSENAAVGLGWLALTPPLLLHPNVRIPLCYPYSYYRGNLVTAVAITSSPCETFAVHGDGLCDCARSF